MRAIVTVLGKDRVGITANVCALDTSACTVSIGEMRDILEKDGETQNLSIRIQREDIFNAMHRI